MIDRSRIGLNRIIHPDLNLEEFLKLAADLSVCKVELRNDLPNGEIIDTYSPEQVRELAEKSGIQIITINALQHFNVSSLLPVLLEQLQELVNLSTAISCNAIVLCPHNSVNDKRSPEQRFQETVDALKEFAPVFAKHGLMGYVEPLGFEESSLRSLVTAMKAIQESGSRYYKIVHDTFHHHIGPDTLETLDNEYDVSYTGLIHVSGVESDLSTNQYRDAHRILVTPADKLKSREQIEKLITLGYEGDISFEPFAEDVQQMELEDLKTVIQESIAYILGG
jgi:2-keto-myo-inositol isomerase